MTAPWPEMPSASIVFDNRQYFWNENELRIFDFDYNLGVNNWIDGPDLPLKLQGRSIVEAEELLYALGGCTETYSFPFYVVA